MELNIMKKFISFCILCLAVLAPAAGVSQSRAVIAILDFKNATGDDSYKYLQIALPEMFATDLAQSAEITVLERDRIKKVLDENGLIMAGVTEGDEKKIGKLLAAKQLLTGTIIKTGNNLRIDVRVTDMSTGSVIAAEKRQCRTANEIIDAVDNLSEAIVKKITGKKIDIAKDIDTLPPPKDSSGLVRTEVLQQNRYCMADSKEPFFIRAGYIAAEYKSEKERLPLNICVVLDRSGSMSDEGKLTYAKEAIKFVIKNMNKNDIFSLVVYDDDVEVIINPVKVTDKNVLNEAVDKIEVRGSTNLSGGMLEGYNQVKKNFKSGQVNRVLLISDGLANVGVTDPSAIQRNARERSREGITISTFGVGRDFNEKLMAGISEYGNANYYFIDRSDRIPEIFLRELEGLLAVVAQNCGILVRPAAGTEILDVFGYKYERRGGDIFVKLGDVVSEEKKLVLIKMKPSVAGEGARELASVSFSYDDAVGGMGRIEKESAVRVHFTKNRDLVNTNVNSIVMKDTEMFVSSEAMVESMDLVEKGSVDIARKKMSENLSRVKTNLRRYNSKELKKQALNIMEYQQKLEDYEKAPAATKSDSYQIMQKSGRSKQYEMQKRK
jgi:Ca-activated chloride channel family protein